MMFEYFAPIINFDIVKDCTLAHGDSEAPRMDCNTIIVVQIYYLEVTMDYEVILCYDTIAVVVIVTTDDGYIYFYLITKYHFVRE